jgi:hypothetical protein
MSLKLKDWMAVFGLVTLISVAPTVLLSATAERASCNTCNPDWDCWTADEGWCLGHCWSGDAGCRPQC